MKFSCALLGVAFFCIFKAPAATLYVSLASTNPVPPYVAWSTAATNIQDAVNASTNGDLILVTNGTYQSGGAAVVLPPPPVGGPAIIESNRLVVTRAVMVQSVNGPGATAILGSQVPGTTFGSNAVRCAWLTNGATLSGFTLTGGATRSGGSGGGVFCLSNAAVFNCIVFNNAADSYGGGASGGALSGCTLIINSATYGGGTAFGTLSNCSIAGNVAALFGGGAYSNVLADCSLSDNEAKSGGGTAFCTVNNCWLTGNSATDTGGGSYNSAVHSSLITFNSAAFGGGASGGNLNDCTIVNNLATSAGGGIDSSLMNVNNCIVYYNTAPAQSNWYFGTLNYCCTYPMPGSGAGNFTDAPAFVNLPDGDFHLRSNSPCINVGNNAYVATSTDRDGKARIVNGVVDVGAYEYQGSVRYVNLASTNPIAPYSDWSIAATNIQDAINAATNGDLVLVTNGVYRNGIVTTNAITIQSVNGPGATIIDGNQTSVCAQLADGSTLIGFTLTNGYTMFAGAGVLCASTNVFIFNCLIISNSVYGGYGAVFYGTLSNCTITCNISLYGDGVGAAFSVLNKCTLSANSVPQRLSQGGGAGEGGGALECTLNNCVLVGNQAAWGAGAAASTLNNCLVANNTSINYFAPEGDAIGGGLFACYATNCTIVNNTVYFPKNTSPRGGGVYAGTSDNCIIYGNKFYYYSLVYLDNYSGGTFNNCCTTPRPDGQNNVTNAPLFVNQNGGDYHLQSLSSCINAGNNAYVIGAADLDGNPRIAGGTADIGAYEYQTPVSRISYAWLQQYGLSPTTNIDTADLDGTGFTVYQDWIAGLNPTNAQSVLAMLPPAPTNSPTGLIVSWESVSNRTYYLQSSTNLGMQPAFSTIQSNVVGQSGVTTYLDTSATNAGPYFYRVGVQ